MTCSITIRVWFLPSEVAHALNFLRRKSVGILIDPLFVTVCVCVCVYVLDVDFQCPLSCNIIKASQCRLLSEAFKWCQLSLLYRSAFALGHFRVHFINSSLIFLDVFGVFTCRVWVRPLHVCDLVPPHLKNIQSGTSMQQNTFKKDMAITMQLKESCPIRRNCSLPERDYNAIADIYKSFLFA